MLIERTVTVPRAAPEVFAYLADFTTTEEWEPGTVTTTHLEGDGGVGTRYHNVSRFLGRTTELEYVVEQCQAPHLLQLRGENKTVISMDTMTLTPTTTGGTTVHYRAEFTFKGRARLVAPLLAPAFKRLGDRAAERLGDVLS